MTEQLLLVYSICQPLAACTTPGTFQLLFLAAATAIMLNLSAPYSVYCFWCTPPVIPCCHRYSWYASSVSPLPQLQFWVHFVCSSETLQPDNTIACMLICHPNPLSTHRQQLLPLACSACQPCSIKLLQPVTATCGLLRLPALHLSPYSWHFSGVLKFPHWLLGPSHQWSIHIFLLCLLLTGAWMQLSPNQTELVHF